MSSGYDVRFINPFLDAVLNVLGTMAKVTATPGKPFINTSRTYVGDVTGVIDIMGHAKGVVSVTFEKGAILGIVNAMLGEQYTEIGEQVADAVGELTNMITGQARMHLAKQGMKYQASTPTVVSGKGHTVKHISSAPILSIPFATDSGSLIVEMSMAGGASGPVNSKKSIWRKPPGQ